MELNSAEVVDSCELSVARDVGRVTGTVMQDDKPAEGVVVVLIPTDLTRRKIARNTANAQTDANGAFEMIGVVPGEYFAFAVIPADDAPYYQLDFPERNRENAVCCGTSGWANCSTCSKQIQVERLREAKKTGASTLITACPKCQIHLNCAKSTMDLELGIKDLTAFIAETMQKSTNRSEQAAPLADSDAGGQPSRDTVPVDAPLVDGGQVNAGAFQQEPVVVRFKHREPGKTPSGSGRPFARLHFALDNTALTCAWPTNKLTP